MRVRKTAACWTACLAVVFGACGSPAEGPAPRTGADIRLTLGFATDEAIDYEIVCVPNGQPMLEVKVSGPLRIETVEDEPGSPRTDTRFTSADLPPGECSFASATFAYDCNACDAVGTFSVEEGIVTDVSIDATCTLALCDSQ